MRKICAHTLSLSLSEIHVLTYVYSQSFGLAVQVRRKRSLHQLSREQAERILFFSLTRFPTRRYRTSFYVVFHFQMHNFRIRLIYSTRCSVFFMFTPHIHARIRIHYVTEKKYKGCSTYDFFVKIIRKQALLSTRKREALLGLGFHTRYKPLIGLK